MQTKRSAFPLPALSLLLAAFILVFAAAPAPTQGRASDIVKRKCTRCHDLRRVCRALGAKDKRAWAGTVDRMIKKRGAPLTASDRVVVIRWLSRLKPEAKPICN